VAGEALLAIHLGTVLFSRSAMMLEPTEQSKPETSITDSFHWHDSVGSIVLGVIALALLVALLRCNAGRLREAKQG
jgi:hypothetical protein